MLQVSYPFVASERECAWNANVCERAAARAANTKYMGILHYILVQAALDKC